MSDWDPETYRRLYPNLYSRSDSELYSHFLEYRGDHVLPCPPGFIGGQEEVDQYCRSGWKSNLPYRPPSLWYSVAVSLHIGSMEIFKRMWSAYRSFFLRQDLLWFVTVHSDTVAEKVRPYLSPFSTEIKVIPNRGRDIGGLLWNLQRMRSVQPLLRGVWILHTKANDHWRENLLSPILQHALRIESSFLEESTAPHVMGAKKCVCSNHKAVNRRFVMDILARHPSLFSNDVLDRVRTMGDEYLPDMDEYRTKDALCLNIPFYRVYENQKGKTDHQIREHWNQSRQVECHRIPNPNYIQKLGTHSAFVGGTMMVLNRSLLNLLWAMNLEGEAQILEEGDFWNEQPRKTHAWEYFLALVCYGMGGEVKSIDPCGQMESGSSSFLRLRPQSFLPHPLLQARGAVFLDRLPSRLLWSWLASHSVFIDLYFGSDTSVDSMGLSTTRFTLDSILDSMTQISTTRFNIYLGLCPQRAYFYRVASSLTLARKLFQERTMRITRMTETTEGLYHIQEEY